MPLECATVVDLYLDYLFKIIFIVSGLGVRDKDQKYQFFNISDPLKSIANNE